MKALSRRRIEVTNPAAVTLGDCLLAYQMGYRAEIRAGKLIRFKREWRTQP
jgi:hypothetical protein